MASKLKCLHRCLGWISSGVVFWLAVTASANTWSSWVQLASVPEAGGSNVNVMIQHDGSWRSNVGYGITDLETGHGRAFGYTVAGTNFLSTDTGRLRRKLVSRVASALDAERYRMSGTMQPYLSTTNELFAFDIGSTTYYSI